MLPKSHHSKPFELLKVKNLQKTMKFATKIPFYSMHLFPVGLRSPEGSPALPHKGRYSGYDAICDEQGRYHDDDDQVAIRRFSNPKIDVDAFLGL